MSLKVPSPDSETPSSLFQTRCMDHGRTTFSSSRGAAMSRTLNGAGVGLEPMYAGVGHEIPTGRNWVFEPKYDGVRALAQVTARGVHLTTRNGNDKARQFP